MPDAETRSAPPQAHKIMRGAILLTYSAVVFAYPRPIPQGTPRSGSLPSLPKRQRSEPVVEPKRGELPWEQLDGSAQPGKALQRAAKRIWDEIELVANPNGSDKKRRHIEKRIDQLVAATFNRKEALDSLARMEQPNATHQAVATGVAAKLMFLAVAAGDDAAGDA